MSLTQLGSLSDQELRNENKSIDQINIQTIRLFTYLPLDMKFRLAGDRYDNAVSLDLLFLRTGECGVSSAT